MRIGRLVIKNTPGVDPRVWRGDVILWSLTIRNQADCLAAGLGIGTVAQLLRNTNKNLIISRESFLAITLKEGFYEDC